MYSPFLTLYICVRRVEIWCGRPFWPADLLLGLGYLHTNEKGGSLKASPPAQSSCLKKISTGLHLPVCIACHVTAVSLEWHS